MAISQDRPTASPATSLHRPVTKEIEFPIPLTSIEKFHWFDHDAEYPNWIFGRLWFDLPLDANLARSAWLHVVQRHPLGGKVPERLGGRWQWREVSISEQADQLFRFHQQTSKPAADQWDLPELQQQTLPRLTLRNWNTAGSQTPDSKSSGATACFCVNHALGDGVGCALAVMEWLLVYNNLKAGREPETGLHQIAAEQLPFRNRLGLTQWRYLKHLWKQPVALFGAAKFIFRRTARLESGLKKDEPTLNSTAGRRSRLESVWVNQQITEGVYQLAKEFQVTSNAVLLGVWFSAVSKFLNRRGVSASKQPSWIRVILPISIRSVADRRLPINNRTSIVQIDRPEPGDLSNGRFFQLLQREINIIRGWQLDRMFLIMIRLLSASDFVLKRVAANPKSRGLSVFTDMGRPLKRVRRTLERLHRDGRCEPTVPFDFDLAGPIRHGTPLNITVARADDRIRITLHYDHTVVSPAEAKQLLDDYLGLLETQRTSPGY